MAFVANDTTDLGDTVLEEGAYILSSHTPGKAAVSGPLQVVFLQQSCENTWPCNRNVTRTLAKKLNFPMTRLLVQY